MLGDKSVNDQYVSKYTPASIAYRVLPFLNIYPLVITAKNLFGLNPEDINLEDINFWAYALST